MPTVPRYERQVREASLPAVNLQTRAPELGPSFPGNEFANFGKAVSGAIERARDEADKVKIKESRNALNKWEIDNVYDYKTGAASKTGESSFQIVPELRGSLDKFVAEQKKNLKSDRQKQALDDMVNDRWGQVEQWANQHMARQLDVVKETTYKATVESSKDRAAANPGVVDTELEVMKLAILDQYGGKLSPEAISEELKNNETDMHKRVIDAYLRDGADEAARLYLGAKKDRIDPDDMDKIQNKIQLREEELKKEKKEQLNLSALNIIEETKDFDSIPKSAVEAMDTSTRTSLRNYAETLAKGDEIETDRVAYHELATMPDKEFKEINLFTYKDKLSDADWKHFSDRKEKVLKGKGDEDGFNGIRTEIKIVSDTLEANGFRSNPDPKKSRKEAEDVAAYWRAVEHNVAELQKRTGKKAGPEDVQKIADDLMLQVKTGTSLFGLRDKTKPLFKIESLRDVPVVDVAEIKHMVKVRKGVEPTDEQVLKIYQKRIAGEQNGR